MEAAVQFAQSFVQLWLDRRFGNARAVMGAKDRDALSVDDMEYLWSSMLRDSPSPPDVEMTAAEHKSDEPGDVCFVYFVVGDGALAFTVTRLGAGFVARSLDIGRP